MFIWFLKGGLSLESLKLWLQEGSHLSLKFCWGVEGSWRVRESTTLRVSPAMVESNAVSSLMRS